MKIQDYLIDSIRHHVKEVFDYARQVPTDKLEWKPLDTGRSVLDQLQEVAQTPVYTIPMLTGEKKSEGGAEEWQKLVEERKRWSTIEACEQAAQENYEKLYAAIRELPDENLGNTVWLPYDGGRDFTMVEIMEYPRWNANYHAGQIAYIQTLYGDTEMR